MRRFNLISLRWSFYVTNFVEILRLFRSMAILLRSWFSNVRLFGTSSKSLMKVHLIQPVNETIFYVNIFRPFFSCKMKIPRKWSELRSFLMKWSEWTNCFFFICPCENWPMAKIAINHILIASLQVSYISPFTKTTMAFHLLFNATVCKFLISISINPFAKTNNNISIIQYSMQ